MLSRRSLGILVLTVVATACYLGLRARPEPAGIEPSADAIVTEALRYWHVPGAAVAVVRGDEVIYLKGHGVREAGSDVPVTPDTLFAIGSTTKAFTATALAMLADDGTLSLDDPVRRHFDAFRLSDPLADRDASFRDLLCHRTGIPRHDILFYGDPADRATLIHRIGLVRPTKPFRTTFQYNNILYVAAGEAAASAAGTTWEELIQSRIFQPLGMTRANFHVAEAERTPDHATPHAWGDGDEPRPVAWRNEDNGGPAGSINANARDLARWLRFQLGDGTFEGRRLLSAARLAETHAPHMPIPVGGPDARYKMTRDTQLLSYGLGWMIQEYRGHLVVFHGGTVRGFRTQVAILPRDNLALVVLANRSPSPFPSAVRNSLIDRLLGLPPVNWNADYTERGRLADVARQEAEARVEGQRRPGTQPSLSLAEYTGTYRDAAYGPTRVFLRDESLYIAWGPLEAKLQHYHDDTFRADGASYLDGELATFVLGASGQVERLLLLGQEWTR